jgi:Protein of unknown function (DUF1761)
MKYLNVLAAGVGAYVFAAVWYIVMSRAWVVAAGIPVDSNGRPMGNGSVLPFVVGIVAQVLVAGMMRHIFATSGIVSIGGGAVAGAGIRAFIIAPWVAMNYSFAMRKPALSLIDGVNSVVGCTIMGIILSAF